MTPRTQHFTSNIRLVQETVDALGAHGPASLTPTCSALHPVAVQHLDEPCGPGRRYLGLVQALEQGGPVQYSAVQRGRAHQGVRVCTRPLQAWCNVLYCSFCERGMCGDAAEWGKAAASQWARALPACEQPSSTQAPLPGLGARPFEGMPAC